MCSCGVGLLFAYSLVAFATCTPDLLAAQAPTPISQTFTSASSPRFVKRSPSQVVPVTAEAKLLL